MARSPDVKPDVHSFLLPFILGQGWSRSTGREARIHPGWEAHIHIQIQLQVQFSVAIPPTRILDGLNFQSDLTRQYHNIIGKIKKQQVRKLTFLLHMIFRKFGWFSISNILLNKRDFWDMWQEGWMLWNLTFYSHCVTADRSNWPGIILGSKTSQIKLKCYNYNLQYI